MSKPQDTPAPRMLRSGSNEVAGQDACWLSYGAISLAVYRAVIALAIPTNSRVQAPIHMPSGLRGDDSEYGVWLVGEPDDGLEDLGISLALHPVDACAAEDG